MTPTEHDDRGRPLGTPFPEALKRCGGELEILLVTAQMVSEDAPAEAARIDAALGTGDLSSARASAHALKGMLATFVDGSATDGLKALEQDCKIADLAAAQHSWKRSRPAVDMLLGEIRHFAFRSERT